MRYLRESPPYLHFSHSLVSTIACATHKMGGSLISCGRLRFSSKYSDLTVTCNYRQWSVHKAIVCSRSGFFDGACSSQFREGNTGVIDLSDDDEEAVGHMINCKDWMRSSRRCCSKLT